MFYWVKLWSNKTWGTKRHAEKKKSPSQGPFQNLVPPPTGELAGPGFLLLVLNTRLINIGFPFALHRGLGRQQDGQW